MNDEHFSPSDMRAWRLKANITQYQLAAWMAYSASRIRAWEHGRAPMPVAAPQRVREIVAHVEWRKKELTRAMEIFRAAMNAPI